MLQDPTLAPENKGDTLKPSHPVQVEEAGGEVHRVDGSKIWPENPPAMVIKAGFLAGKT